MMDICIKHKYINLRTFLFYIIIVLTFFACNSAAKIKDGTTAYNLKQYDKAIVLLEKEFNENNNKTEKAAKAFLLGNVNTMLLDNEEALKWYKMAEELNYGPAASIKVAYGFKKVENYHAAIAQFKLLETQVEYREEAKRQVFICEDLLRSLSNDSPEWRIMKIGEDGIFSDYSPTIFDDDYLVFTSDRDEATGNSVYNWTGNKYSDLFIMPKSGNKAVKFDANINSDANDGTACFSKDYTEMFFTRCFELSGNQDANCRIMYSKRKDGIWSEPIVLSFIEQNINYGQPCLIENDSVLVFSRMSEGNATGYDLWYVERFNDGSWSQAYPMPRSINTDGNEYFPTSNNDTLYFSSDQLPGYGGLDIFKTGLSPNGSWSKPENLGYPINSGGDDYGFVIDKTQRPKAMVEMSGYMTSSRLNDGSDHLFYFEKMGSSKEEIEKTTDKEDQKKSNSTIYLAIKVSGKKYAKNDDPSTATNGKTSLKMAKIRIETSNGHDTTMYADKNGLSILQIPKDETFTITASSPEYLSNAINVTSMNLNSEEIKESYTINAEILLDRIFRGKEIVLENIFYDYDKFDIRDDARPTLDKLSNLLKNNKDINIELGSHTDCRGEEAYNQILSQKRAQSAVDYLISSGIDTNRLKAIGYGESRLADNCQCDTCTEAQHQTNRRTTFKIL